jgi:O-antigen/teichoic acid export membrane protein
MVKIIIIIAFVAILFSLGKALFHLVNYEEQSKKTVNALTFRISLSILLFIFLFIAVATGLIKPHGIATKMHKPALSNNPEHNEKK